MKRLAIVLLVLYAGLYLLGMLVGRGLSGKWQLIDPLQPGRWLWSRITGQK